MVTEPVALSDLGPTLLSLAGHAEPLGDGRDLSPATRGEALPPRALFLEATRVPSLPRDGSWDNLGAERGVIWQETMMSRTPWLPTEPPTLLKIGADGVTPIHDPRALVGLTGMLNAWDGRAPPGRAQETPEGAMRDALKALGYLEE